MRICIVYQAEFPPSERIEKTAQSLTAAGHQVFLVCNDYGKFAGRPEEQVGPVYTIRVGPALGNRKLARVLKFPAFANPVWISAMMRAIRRFGIEAIQVVDVPLAPAAIALGRMFNIPVIYDMWENYPEALRGWGTTSMVTRIFKNHRVARAAELWSIRRADHVFTVVEEARDRVIADGVSPERVSVVTNGVDLEMFTSATPLETTAMDSDPGSFNLLYVGAITIERGLDDIIRALPLLRERIPGIRLYIAGSGTDEARLRRISAESGVDDLVRFTGWIPFGQIHSYIVRSHLCLVPHVYNDFINTTIPNKLFQYMAMSKPILVSNAKPLARIVRQCDCGFVFESGNPADAAEQIYEAWQRRADDTIGERGRICAEAEYTWNHAARDLIRVYSELSDARRSASRAGRTNRNI